MGNAFTREVETDRVMASSLSATRSLAAVRSQAESLGTRKTGSSFRSFACASGFCNFTSLKGTRRGRADFACAFWKLGFFTAPKGAADCSGLGLSNLKRKRRKA